MKFKALPVLLPWLALMGCTSMPYGNAAIEPSFRVYQDILQGSAISDSPLFKPVAVAAVACQPPAAASDPTLISPVSAPGLHAMLSQVDPHNPMLARGEAPPAPLPDIFNLPLTRAYVISLAASYHNSRVRRWAASSPCAAQRVKEANNMVAAGQQPPPGTPTEYSVAQNLKDEFSVKQFFDFGKALLNTNLEIVNHPATALGLNSPAPATATASAAANPPFGQFLAQYLLAYYNGNFVDRDGTQPAKPSIGLTITDTTLSNAATVGMDAIYDYIVLSVARQGGSDAIKAPVVYDMQTAQSAGAAAKPGTTTPTVKWQNPKALQPTLASIIQAVKVTTSADSKSATVTLTGQPTNGTFTLTIGTATTAGIAYNAPAAAVQSAIQKPAGAPKATVAGPAGGPYVITFPAALSGPVTASGSGLYMQYVVEPLAKDGSAGMTPAKIQLVRLLQGLAGDGATGLSGLIMRTFGGVHVGVTAGLGVLGKISIGDNATLANLVEAVVGVFAANSSELFASDQLYDITYPPNPSTTGNPLAIAVLQFISNLNLSPPATSAPAPAPAAQVAAPHLADGGAPPLRLSETDR